MNDQHLRMSDAERDLAAADLGEHYAQGRLTLEEHTERLDRIWVARTRGELGPIFADLPGSGAPTPATGPMAWPRASASVRRASRPRGRGLRGVPWPLGVLLVVLLTVTVFSHLPIILIGLGAWFLLSRKHCAPASRRAHWS